MNGRVKARRPCGRVTLPRGHAWAWCTAQAYAHAWATSLKMKAVGLALKAAVKVLRAPVVGIAGTTLTTEKGQYHE